MARLKTMPFAHHPADLEYYTENPDISTRTRIRNFARKIYTRRRASGLDKGSPAALVSNEPACPKYSNDTPKSQAGTHLSPPQGSSSPLAFTPRRLECNTSYGALEDFKVRMPIGHFASSQPASPTAAPKAVTYPRPQQPLQAEPSTAGRLNRLNEICVSCGLRRFQCDNAINFFGTDFGKLDRIDVRVEERDVLRLTQYLRMVEEVNDAKSSGTQAKMYLIGRNGSAKKQVDVWVGLVTKPLTRIEAPVISVCNQKKAQIIQNFQEHVDSIEMGTPATAYLVDTRGECIFGVRFIRPKRNL